MRIRFDGSTAHLQPEMRPAHGPQEWPWWRLASASVVRLDIWPPSKGWRLWVYTRWGAVYGDVVFDRRPR